MTEQSNSGGKGYNLKITPKDGTIDTTPSAKGTAKIKFRGTFEQRGKQVERTVVAQGKAADAIAAIVVGGQEIGLRCLFDRAPASEEGKKGGEFLTVLGIPLPPKAKAA